MHINSVIVYMLTMCSSKFSCNELFKNVKCQNHFEDLINANNVGAIQCCVSYIIIDTR